MVPNSEIFTLKNALIFVCAYITCEVGYRLGLELWCMAYPYIN